MKKWINPPINGLLTLLSILLLAYAVWAVMTLKMTDVESVEQQHARVNIPDASTLSTPPLRDYKSMIEAPLFWQARKPYKPPKPEPLAQKPVEKPVDTSFPNARLTGVIDMGSSKMVVLKDNQSSHYLRVDDDWGAWRLAAIDKEQARFTLADEEKVLSLIDDYQSPKANRHAPPPPAARHVASVAKQAANHQANQQQESVLDKPSRLPVDEIKRKQIPVGAVPKGMSIKEALAARQRLIAERWRKQAE